MIAFTVAWVLSLGTLIFGEPEYADGISGVGACLLPWMVLAGLPRSQPPRERAAAVIPVGLAAAPLAMAVWLERGTTQWSEALIGLALVGLLAWAAACAARSKARAFRYGIAWIALVLVLPLMHGVLVWLGTALPGGLRWVAAASPTNWAWDISGFPWTPLASCLGLLAIANLGDVDREETL